jgi:hypothetical protein
VNGERNRSVPITVLIIDDGQREAENAAAYFGQTPLGANIRFIIKSPDDVENLADWLQLTEDLSVSAVLLDHRLGESSNASYTGLELADSLRDVKPLLPLFILTKYASDERLESNGFSVDDVLDKERLRQDAAAAYVARILRGIGRYEEAKSNRAKHLSDLISLSLSRELSSEEKIELNTIRSELGLPILIRQLDLADEAHDVLESKKELLAGLRKLLGETKE